MSLIVYMTAHNTRITSAATAHWNFSLLHTLDQPIMLQCVKYCTLWLRRREDHSSHGLEQQESDQQPNNTAQSGSASTVSMKATAPSDSSLSKKLITATTVPSPGGVLLPSCSWI